MAGPGGRKPEPEPLGCSHTRSRIHSFIHSFIRPATLALANTWGPMEESPPLNSRRGRRDFTRVNKPHGEPQRLTARLPALRALSTTPPPPTLTLATRLRTLWGTGHPGDSSGSWGIARGSGPRCVPSGFVSNDPLSLRVARMSPLPPGSIRRGPPLRHSGLGARVSALGPWLGPGTWGHQLPSPCA